MTMKHFPSLIAWLVVCFAPAATGAFVSVGDWYAQLNKPSWNPPSWIFGPVWTTLYAMMAVSAWTIWKSGGWENHRTALALFIVQLSFNALWTPLFFGLHNPRLAFACIVALWISIALTIRSFLPISQTAGLLLVPYQLWVSFAAVLNFTICRLNP